MARDVDHVIGSPHDVDEAIVIQVATITGVVVTRVSLQISLQVALMIAPQGLAATGRQRQGDDDGALMVRAQQVPIVIQHTYVIARHRAVARARPRRAALQPHAWRGDWPASLGLPPMVVHRLAGNPFQPLVGT